MKKYMCIVPLFFLTVAGFADDIEITNGDLSLKIDSLMYVKITSPNEGTDSFSPDFHASDYLVTRDVTFKNFVLLNIGHRDGGDIETYHLSGISKEDGYEIEKKTVITKMDAFPGMLFFDIKYVNRGNREPVVTAWVNHELYMNRADTALPVWSLQASSSNSRSDWILPVTPGFHKKNYLGMNSSDYGGGIPVSCLWRRDGGFSTGLTENVLKPVSLPVDMPKYGNDARTGILYEYPAAVTFKKGDTIPTFHTFISVYTGDFFNPLRQFSKYMQLNGVQFAESEEEAYEPVWCAWGYERNFTLEEIKAALPKVREVGFKWVDIDDGYQVAIGDWDVNGRFHGGDGDMKSLTDMIHDYGLKAKLWWAPMAADPCSEILKTKPEMKLLTKERLPCMITWWNSFYLSPVNPVTKKYTEDLVEKFIRAWNFDGLKLDGQHLNCCPPDYNPHSKLDYPEQAMELLPELFRSIFETARKYKPDAVVQNCPCGTAMNFFNMPYMNQAVSSDPLSSWQIRLKGKVYKAIFNKIAYYADHVELSDNGNDFPSQTGIGGVVGSKFTYPKNNPHVEKSYLLTPEKEILYKKWLRIYNDKMLSKGEYLNLYDLGYDKPEAHVIRKDGKMYYAFYAEDWTGEIILRGLEKGKYTVTEYADDLQNSYEIDGSNPVVHARFKGSYLIEVTPL